MSIRAHLAALGIAVCLGLSAVGSASADPLTEVGQSLHDAGLPNVEVPPVPQVEVPDTGIAPVDGIVDTVNNTVRETTDTVNEVTSGLGGGNPAEPSTPTPTPDPGTGATDQPVQTGSAPPPQTGGGAPASGPQDTTSNGANDGGGGGPAGSGAAAGAGAAAAGGRGGSATPPAPATPAAESAAAQGALITLAGPLPWSLFILTVAFAAIGVWMSVRSAMRARRNRSLQTERGELRADVGAMQSALLPAIPDSIGGAALGVAYRPAEGPAAGGDFHDVLELPEGRIGIVVGDVCGHGRGALANTALVHYTVRAYLEAGLEPRDALRLTNAALTGKLGEDFVAVVAAVYDPDQSTLDYATAGHPTPLITGERDRSVGVLTPPPIGVGLHTGHRQTRISVPAGSRIWFFTDGLVEARDENGKMFDRSGLAQILAADPEAPPEEVLDRIAAHGGARDDMTAFVIAPEAGGDRSTDEEIDVDREVAAGSGLPRFLAACGLDPGEVERAVDAAQRRLRLAGSARIRARSHGIGPRWELSGTPEPQGPDTAPANGSSAEAAMLAGSRT